MLFNSAIFLFLFLPLALLGFHASLTRVGLRAALSFLALASLAFYTYWHPPYLFILLGSIVINFYGGHLIGNHTGGPRKICLTLFILFNLCLLGYFKYAGFFLSIITEATGKDWAALHLFLPLGISFFTFQKIAYLIDIYKGRIERQNFIDYLLFVSFFPQLIAGPIVHYNQIVPQFLELTPALARRYAAAGMALFSFGLFKKIVIADSLMGQADPLFTAVENGYAPTFLEAWGATLSYSFQIYFDFSGYTDMALGLAMLFGVRLPANFCAPYKATGYIEFWRRWHMTLSRFLRDYLYIPLGGNRRGEIRKYANLVLTMLIGGLWHGASWNFVLWGGLHGLLIACNHLLRRLGLADRSVARPLGWLATFSSVSLLWVLFRSQSFSGAALMYHGLFHPGDLLVPENLWVAAPEILRKLLSYAGVEGGTLTYFRTVPLFVTLTGAAATAFLLPCTTRLFRIEDGEMDSPLLGKSLFFSPSLKWAIGCGLLFALSLLLLQRESPFLYFQF